MKHSNRLLAEQVAHSVIPLDGEYASDTDYLQQWQIALEAATFALERKPQVPLHRRFMRWMQCDECDAVLFPKAWCTTCGDNEAVEGVQDVNTPKMRMLGALVSISVCAIMIGMYVAF